MDKLLIKNGSIFDPLNDIEGEIKDILIEGGKIVEKFSNQTDIKEIDAKNKTVVPSAIDIHTHITSQQVDWIRLLGSKNKKFQELWEGMNLNFIAREFISKGYTFLVEANVFPSLAKQTIFNFKSLPVLDKAALLNISNLWPLELEFQRGSEEEACEFLSDLLFLTKSYGFKIYNPFEAESWNFQRLRENLKIKGRLYNFSPLDVYKNCTKYNEFLGLPHSVHAHIEGYEQNQGKENLTSVLKDITSLNLETSPQNNLNINRSQLFHIAHASSYNLDGDNTELIEVLNKNQKFDLDLAFLGFDRINPLITCDRRLINSLISHENPYQLIRAAVESEGDSYATFRNFDKNDRLYCNFWANALDLALNINNKWQMQFTINFPNYAHIKNVAQISTWLMSEKARLTYMKDMNKEFLKDNSLQNNHKELTFNEYVILTRSSPAKSFGIGSIKGNLGTKADGDLNILNINLEEIDLSKDYKEIEKALENIEYVIKQGNVIKKGDLIDLKQEGRIFWTRGNFKSGKTTNLLSKKKEFYQKYYSIFYETLQSKISNNIQMEIV